MVNIIKPYVETTNQLASFGDSDSTTAQAPGTASTVQLSQGERSKVQAMFQRFAPKYIPLLFRQYDQLHGKWEGDTSSSNTNTSSSTSTSASGLETESTTSTSNIPKAPPPPLNRLQYPIGGIGQGGSAARIAATLEAATKYLSISSPATVQKFGKQLLTRLAKACLPVTQAEYEANSGVQITKVRQVCVLLGLSLALIPSAQPAQLRMIFRGVKVALGNINVPLVHTRCYAALETICRREHGTSEASPQHLLFEIAQLLQESLVSISAKAKRRRLRCLRLLIEQGGTGLLIRSAAASSTEDSSSVEDDAETATAEVKVGAGKAWMVGLVGEIVLCTKESNAKAREAAFELLIALGRAALKESGEVRTIICCSVVVAAAAVGGCCCLLLLHGKCYLAQRCVFDVNVRFSLWICNL